MSHGYNGSNFRCLIFLLLALIQCWSNVSAKGGISGVKKTIKSSDGDIIDCIDIYKQPAFSNPLLRNHKILIKSYPKGIEARNSSSELFQSWHKDGECPLGTIPTLRTPQRNRQFNTSSVSSNNAPHEIAFALLPNANYYGARGSFNVWVPGVADTEVSIAKMFLESGEGNTKNAMQAGWQVKDRDRNARFFISWTRDSFASTGCYNLDCPGFVQTNHKIALGASIQPVSTYGGKQFEVKLAIKKDFYTGAWILEFQDQFVGYWPESIFTSLAYEATSVGFGGEVSNTEPGGKHTATQMGSGHFAGEGYGKAAYIAHVQFIDENRVFKDVDGHSVRTSITREGCYNLNGVNSPSLGPTVYYGGPGFSPSCE